MKSIETTAKTKDEAVAKALEELGLERSAVSVQVLGEETGGFLGLGGKKVRVRVSEVNGEGGEPEEVVNRILEMMGVDFQLEVKREEETTDIRIIAPQDDGLLIGRRGQTLDALRHLSQRIIAARLGHNAIVNIDVGDYRARREEGLRERAEEAAKEAMDSGRGVSLDPMSAQDRRVIHLALADRPGLHTYTVGGGSRRRVVVAPEGVKERGRGRDDDAPRRRDEGGDDRRGGRDGRRGGRRDESRDGRRDGRRDAARSGRRDGPRDGRRGERPVEQRDGPRDGRRGERPVEQRDGPRDGRRGEIPAEHRDGATAGQRGARPQETAYDRVPDPGFRPSRIQRVETEASGASAPRPAAGGPKPEAAKEQPPKDRRRRGRGSRQRPRGPYGPLGAEQGGEVDPDFVPRDAKDHQRAQAEQAARMAAEEARGAAKPSVDPEPAAATRGEGASPIRPNLSETRRYESPRNETPRDETPRAESPRAKTPQVETPQVETPQVETPQAETSQAETSQAETPRVDSPGAAAPRAETAPAGTPSVETSGDESVARPEAEAPHAAARPDGGPRNDRSRPEGGSEERPRESRSEGRDEGRDEGRSEGRSEGRDEGRREDRSGRRRDGGRRDDRERGRRSGRRDERGGERGGERGDDRRSRGREDRDDFGYGGPADGPVATKPEEMTEVPKVGDSATEKPFTSTLARHILNIDAVGGKKPAGKRKPRRR